MPVILVVEDDQVMRKAIGSILNRGGYSVLNATNGKEAMEMLNTASYDVVITDLMMPYANGLEVVNRIRSDQNKKDVGVIIVSATSNEDMVTEAFSLGADDYLKKPVMAGELVSRIRKLIKRQVVEPARGLPEDIADIEEQEADIQRQPTEPSYLIAVSRYVHEQAVGDGLPPNTNEESTPVAATPAVGPDDPGMWRMEESVPHDAGDMLPEPGDSPKRTSPGAAVVAPAPVPNKGVNGYMKQIVLILAVVALLVIGMLLYVAL